MKYDAIPGYRIERLIGRGGMASVYLATQKSLRRPVALKVLNNPDSPTFSERFINEGRIIAGLSHTNIITVHDVGIVDAWHYISMEYVEGGDLKHRIAKGNSTEDALELIKTIANCLDFAHKQGIIHRDVKPGNILFRVDGTPVLTDFGIAKHLDISADLTITGTTIGSPNYISPEQAQGRSVDGRVDIYSLGIILYEMLVGQRPYTGDSLVATMFKHINDPVPKLPAVYRRYQSLLERMLAKDPKRRFSSAGDVVEAIETLNESANITDRIGVVSRYWQAIDWRRLSPNLAAIKRRLGLGLSILLLVLGGTIIFSNLDESDEAPSAKQDTKVGTVPVVSERSASIPEVEEFVVAPAPKETSLSVEDPSKVEKPGLAIGKEIKRLLALAHDSLEAYRLTSPFETSALRYYNQVMALDPDNTDAAQGYSEIAKRYSWLAGQRIRRGDYRQAREYIRLGLEVQPGDQTLIDLRRRVNSTPRTPTHFRGIHLRGIIERVKDLFR